MTDTAELKPVAWVSEAVVTLVGTKPKDMHYALLSGIRQARLTAKVKAAIAKEKATKDNALLRSIEGGERG